MVEEPVDGHRAWWRRRPAKVVLGLAIALTVVALLDQIPAVRFAYQRLTMSKQERHEIESLLQAGQSGEQFERSIVIRWLRQQHHSRQAAWQDMSDDERARAVRAASAIPEHRRRQLYCEWLRVQAEAVRDAVRESDLAGIDIEADPMAYLGRVNERGRLADVRAIFDMSGDQVAVTETGRVAELPIDHALVDGWCRQCEAARWLAAADDAPCLTSDQLE